VEWNRTVVTGGVLRSPPSTSASPLTEVSNSSVMRVRGRHCSRSYDCGDNIVADGCNNNSNIIAVTTINKRHSSSASWNSCGQTTFIYAWAFTTPLRHVDRLSVAPNSRGTRRSTATFPIPTVTTPMLVVATTVAEPTQ